jgi:hypothetical protein
MRRSQKGARSPTEAVDTKTLSPSEAFHCVATILQTQNEIIAVLNAMGERVGELERSVTVLLRQKVEA